MNAWVTSIVSQEQPIHIEVLIRRLRDPWRARGLRASFRNMVVGSVESLVRAHAIERVDKNCLVSTGTPLSAVVRAPDADEATMRSAAEVAVSERVLAMIYMIGDAREMGREELFQKVARVFGWGRTASRITDELMFAFDALLTAGLVTIDPRGVCRLTPEAQGEFRN
jgi:hypothetical protein